MFWSKRILATGLAFMTAFIVHAASASTVDQYLHMRRQSGLDRKLTYAMVEANASAYMGRVIELCGRMNGSIQRGQSVSFMLGMDDDKTVLLTAPVNETKMVTGINTQMLRVLARVAEPAVGNVVPLEVLSIAYDGEVSAREREAQAKLEHQQSQHVVNRKLSSRPTELTYRGSGGRTSTGGYISPQAQSVLSPEAQAVYPEYRAYIFRCNKRLTEKELDDIACSLLYFSQRHRVDPRLVVAMIIAESNFNPHSTSRKGAMGLGQIMPAVARDHDLVNPYDPIQNVRTTVNLLKMKLNSFSQYGSTDGHPTVNQVMLALAAYNAGSGAVKKYGGIPPYRETQRYIQRILSIYKMLAG